MPTKTPGKVSRQALIVLGMHRTGTSAISGVLAQLGVTAPKSLMPSTPDNPRGYWESVALMGFHDRVLESAGSDWSDWGKFNEAWIDSSAGEDFQMSLSTLLDDEYGNSRLMLVKDPRMCRLLPLWINALQNLDIMPKVVIPVRHPDEVAMSLAARDHFGKNQSQLMWLRNTLDAEFSSRGIPRVFIRYSDLLRDWRSQIHKISSELDIKWPRWSGAVEADIEQYLAPKLRHYVSPGPAVAQNSDIAAWVADSYRDLESLMDDDGRSETLQRLDTTRMEFDRTSTIYAPVVHEYRFQSGQKERALAETLATSSIENDHLKAAFAELNEKHQERESRYNAEMDAVQKQLQSRESEHASLESKYRVELADAARQLSVHETVQAGLTAKLQLRDSGYAELESKCHAALADATRLAAENQTAQQSISDRFSEIAKLSALILDSEDRISEANRLTSVKNSQVMVLQEAIEVCESKFRTVEQELEAQRSLVLGYRSKLERIHSSTLWKIATIPRRITRRNEASVTNENDNEVLRHSRLFDASWYLQEYPDIRAGGIDPILHYLKYGAKEGRDPSPAFSTNAYTARYPDVASAGINPLVHYLRHGRQESRVITAKIEAGNDDSKPTTGN